MSIALFIPLGLLALSVWRTIRRGINLGDEGYLVYGTQEVLRGKVPIRDFRAYDPGRYYWCALWARVLGPGFLAIRAAMFALSAVSVVLVYALVVHATGGPLLAAAAGCLALLWMRPLHKQIEVFFSIATCAVLYALVTGAVHPALLGAYAGVTAFFGLNIAAYFVGASLLVVSLAVLSGALGAGAGLLFGVGIVISGAVVLGIARTVPQFMPAYLERKVHPLFARGSTNLRLPLPWVWRSVTEPFRRFAGWRSLVLRGVFTALPVLYLGAMAVALVHDQSAVLLTSAATGAVYFHHVLSRADMGHLYQVLQPAVLMVIALLFMAFGDQGALAGVLLMIAFSVAVLWSEDDFVLGATDISAPTTRVQICGDWLVLPAPLATRLEALRGAVGSPDTMLAAPGIPGMLAVFGARTAVYDTFPVYPATEDAQRAMLDAFSANPPEVAIISNKGIDGRRSLKFENNYPELTGLIRQTYDVALRTSEETVYQRRG